MSNPSLNQIKRNIAKGSIIKGIKNIFMSKQKSNANTDKIIREQEPYLKQMNKIIQIIKICKDW